MLPFESRPRMRYDDVAWERSDEIFELWRKKVLLYDTLKAIAIFIRKHRGGPLPTNFCKSDKGSFNAALHYQFPDHDKATIRFPAPGSTMFPEEKVKAEVIAIKFLKEKTTLPLPFILHWGTKEECPCDLGPFMIMEFIKHESNLSTVMNSPGLDPMNDRPILDPNIDEEKLELLYGHMADVLLQLSKISLPRIGNISEIDEDTFGVTARPLTFNMAELVGLGTLPQSKLSQLTYSSTSSYFEALADLYIAHLSSQRNDAIDDAEDCRRKYIARHLFRKLARERRLNTPSVPDHGPFRIWCDDLRPANVLVDSQLEIAGVIDWEWTYAAPAEFVYAPPWWLLIELPEYWPGGLEAWTREYEKRLPTFLRALESREDFLMAKGMLAEEQRLSWRMRESWESGAFWIAYAVRKPFAFDDIFWREIEPRFFGKQGDEGWRGRIALLEEEERDGMESLVSRKVEEMETRELTWEPNEITTNGSKSVLENGSGD